MPRPSLLSRPGASASMVSSEIILLTDLLLTIRRAHTYRKYRKLLVESGIGVRTPRQAIKILALLVESGVIYILIGVSSVVVYRPGLSRTSFSPQVTSLTSIVVFVDLRLVNMATLFLRVGVQLVVRNS